MSEPVSVSTLIKLLTSSEWEERLDGLRTLANVVITPSQLEPFLVRPRPPPVPSSFLSLMCLFCLSS